MMQFVDFGSRRIHFHLQYSRRKTLGITINSSMEILVTAPEHADLLKIKAKIKSKARWIFKQQNFFLSFHPKTPPRRFLNGETHLYLGRQLQLRIKRNKENKILYTGRTLEVRTTDKSKIQDILQAWYREKAQEKFLEIAKPLIESFKKYKVVPKGLFLKRMPNRWGSCTAQGKIILNPELIMAPKGCIEYVIYHELCHLVHRDHTQKFLNLQYKVMPDWAKWKTKLEKIMA